MKKIVVLILCFAFFLSYRQDTENSTVEKLRVSKIFYEFKGEVRTHLIEKIENHIKIYKAKKESFGLEFNVCDIDNGNYVLSLHFIDEHFNEPFYLNTNKFVRLNDSLVLPLISSDIFFATDIVPETPSNWKGRYSLGRCIEVIYFNHKSKITKIKRCGDGV